MITLNGRELENFNAHTYAGVRYIVFDNNSKPYNVFDTQTIIELEYLIEDIEEGDYKKLKDDQKSVFYNMLENQKLI